MMLAVVPGMPLVCCWGAGGSVPAFGVRISVDQSLYGSKIRGLVQGGEFVENGKGGYSFIIYFYFFFTI